MFYVLFILISIYTLFTLWFAITSFKERCVRAGVMGMVALQVLAFVLGIYSWAQRAGYMASPWAQGLQIALGAAIVLATILMFIPLGRNPKALLGTKGMAESKPEKFNQRDTVFNIAHVGGYGPDVSKKRWALQSQDPFEGLFWTLVMGLKGQVEGKVNPHKVEGFALAEITSGIKETARYLGADLVGITTVKNDFTYSESFSYEESKLEVGPPVTTPIDRQHKYVIVLGKEMNFDRIQAALTEKNEESLGEIGKTYYEIAQIACNLAAYIRQLGYAARAHHLRNEQILHVPHAIDAGLGEQGRHNYLITENYGPRVRLASVTTDLELIENHPIDMGVQDFCQNCRLCESNCPPQAIPGERREIRGYRRWAHHGEKCFLFWVSAANTFTCSQCLKVCPWNKPSSFIHKIGFFAAAKSVVARRALYWLHLVCYGKNYQWQKIPLQEEVKMPQETLTWTK